MVQAMDDETNGVNRSRPIKRRTFVCAASLLAGSMTCGLCNPIGQSHTSDSQSTKEKTMIKVFEGVPNYCGHEHWGSLTAIGTFDDGFLSDKIPGKQPTRPVTFMDILLDPYMGGNLATNGTNIDTLCQAAKGKNYQDLLFEDPVAAYRALGPLIANQITTGTFQCIRNGMLLLYGIDLQTADDSQLANLNDQVSRNYSQLFDWYEQAMQQTAINGVVRPVHPEFFYPEKGQPSPDESFSELIMRIDPLLNLWQPNSPRRAQLAEMVGIEPVDSTSWREFLVRLFDHSAQHKNTGIKQLQAYSRTLRFDQRSDNEVKFVGDLTRSEQIILQDWIMHECCRQAHERNWPHQVHVGTHNLSESSPLPLQSLCHLYPSMKLVQLHCWPFLREAGQLAKVCHNAYIDTCWQPVLNPRFLAESFDSWMNYVPLDKIMLSHDSTSVEMAAGSAVFTRQLLKTALEEQVEQKMLPKNQVEKVATMLLHDNARRLYVC